MELTFRIILTIVFTGVWLIGVRWVWTNQLDPRGTISRFQEKTLAPPDWVATRDPRKLYQNGRAVGDVIGPVEQREDHVRFVQLANTTQFNRSEPFEYQRLTLRVQSLGSIIGMKSEVSEQGPRVLTAVLENVVCTVVK